MSLNFFHFHLSEFFKGFCLWFTVFSYHFLLVCTSKPLTPRISYLSCLYLPGTADKVLCNTLETTLCSRDICQIWISRIMHRKNLAVRLLTEFKYPALNILRTGEQICCYFRVLFPGAFQRQHMLTCLLKPNFKGKKHTDMWEEMSPGKSLSVWICILVGVLMCDGQMRII